MLDGMIIVGDNDLPVCIVINGADTQIQTIAAKSTVTIAVAVRPVLHIAPYSGRVSYLGTLSDRTVRLEHENMGFVPS